jgi:hypothetical protein
VAQTRYTHVNKCKNDKVKGEKKKKLAFLKNVFMLGVVVHALIPTIREV